MKDVLLLAHVVATENFFTSLVGRLCQKIHQKAYRTCSTITFPHSANEIIDSSA